MITSNNSVSSTVPGYNHFTRKIIIQNTDCYLYGFEIIFSGQSF